MKKIGNDIWFLIGAFVISRIILGLCGIHFQYDALYKYWQYLDVETLKHNLLKGVWYDHAQPPFFNLFIGAVLKLFGSSSQIAFSVIFKLITLANTLLLLNLLKQLIKHPRIPIVLATIYLLSPATMLLENELFYTTFISMLLLIAAYFLLQLQEAITWKNAIGFFLPLIIICFSRSMYHLVWLFAGSTGIIILLREKPGLRKLTAAAVFSLAIVASWYVKNYQMFGKFTTSTWIGMNLSRNVFHNNSLDSSVIQSIEPFSPISNYKRFISGKYEKEFKGINDLDLLSEYKNNSDTLRNLNHVSYIEVSDKYLEESKKDIKLHPASYLKNVAQSTIIFFAPATRYPLVEVQSKKIKYYDVLYSFNLSHFAEGNHERRIALSISALPKIALYLLVFFFIAKNIIKSRRVSPLLFFIVFTIGYVFVLSSLVEHYENMRFRYEVEPLFLLLLGQYLFHYLNKKRIDSIAAQVEAIQTNHSV